MKIAKVNYRSTVVCINTTVKVYGDIPCLTRKSFSSIRRMLSSQVDRLDVPSPIYKFSDSKLLQLTV